MSSRVQGSVDFGRRVRPVSGKACAEAFAIVRLAPNTGKSAEWEPRDGGADAGNAGMLIGP